METTQNTAQTNNGHTGLIVGIILLVLAAAGTTLYFLLKPSGQKKPVSPGSTPPITAANATSTTSGFPLTIGSTGTYVSSLQTGLNQYVGVNNLPVTGTFDSATAQACAIAGYSLPIQWSDYNEIVAPPNASNTASTTTSSNGIPSTIIPGSTQYTQISYCQNYSSGWLPGLIQMNAADLNTLYTYLVAQASGTATNPQFNAAVAVVNKYNLSKAGTYFD